tara:strand:+ start:587 stop:919 length:333 start_codon:yes stop_codon:yes gene_type:complete
MKIKVEQKHIDAAVLYRSKTEVNPKECCPIALAVWDHFQWKNVSVGWCDDPDEYKMFHELFYISVQDPDNDYKELVDQDSISDIEQCSKFAEKFDEGEEVKPFEFEIKKS